jgi:hypothetical protein
MRNIIIIVTILFLVAGICYASSGRNEAIEYLHKDKASMLDVGLLRLEQVVQRYIEKAYSYSEFWIVAKYSTKRNLIILNLFINPTHQNPNNREEIRIHSRKAIMYLRNKLSPKILEACFGHGEQFEADYPEGIWETIRDHLYVEVIAPYRGSKSKTPGRINCKGDLSSEGNIICE